jgi:2-methylcitrate dehydratase PrpD
MIKEPEKAASGYDNEAILTFLSGLSIDHLPASVIHEARRAILDTLGCMVAGVDTPLGRNLTAMADQFSGSPGATVLGIKQSTLPFYAAMCNAYMANAHDADDGHRLSRLHAGGIIISSALAAAEKKACNGARFIESVVLGYELGLRAGMATYSDDIYFGSAFGTTFGAAAAVGWILGLTHEQIIMAMGISEMHAPNCMLLGWINSRRIPMIKEGMGWSAATAVMAALMAQGGVRGTLTIFNDREKTARIDRLGQDYEIEKRYYKPHPGCRWVHGPARILGDIMAEHNLTAEDISRVKVRTLDKAALLDNSEPETMDDAQYSIPFVLAAIMVDGEFGTDQMRSEKLTSPLILKHAQKVDIEVEPEFNQHYPAKVCCELVVRTGKDEVFSGNAQQVAGDWELPLSDDDLKNKFVRMCRRRLKAEQMETVVEQVFAIESLENIQDFFQSLNEAVTDLQNW